MLRSLKLRISGSARDKIFLLEESSIGEYYPILMLSITEKDAHYAVFRGKSAQSLCAITDDLESAARAAYRVVKERAELVHKTNCSSSPIEDLTAYAPK